MKVRAITKGFWDNRRWEKGSVFELKEIKGKKQDRDTGKLVDHIFTPKEQLGKWMEPLDGNVELAQEPARKSKTREPRALSKVEKSQVITDLDVI